LFLRGVWGGVGSKGVWKKERKKNEKEKSTRKHLNEFEDLSMKAFDSQT